MSDDLMNSAKAQLDALRRERDRLAEHIRVSQETIERSQDLLKRMDEILAKADQAT